MSDPIAIVQMSPAELVPAGYNPRRMTADARARLRNGIAAFGLVDPIIARRSDRLVIGGHQRLAVALELGMETVPVVLLDDIDDSQAAALNILLNNQAAAGDWDFAALTQLLSTLDGTGFDATLTGFNDKELADMLGASWDVEGAKGVSEAMTDEDAAKVRVIVFVAMIDAADVRAAVTEACAAWPDVVVR